MSVADIDFEQLVDTHYEGLYRFGLGLTRREADASDLVQQTFYRWATKGHQLREKSKVKSWLYTTLHREFLGARRRYAKFPHYEVDMMEHELPEVSSTVVNEMDGGTIVDTLAQVDELYRAPLTLFYLQDQSYQEIAEALEIPIGTVMSRLSRGKKQLRKLLSAAKAGKTKQLNEDGTGSKVVSMEDYTKSKAS